MQSASAGTDAEGNLCVVLRGDVDFTSSAGVMDVISQVAETVPGRDVLVDLAEVTFMDSSGIAVLVRLLRLADERGGHLRLVNPAPKVEDQLHLTGLSDLLGLPPRPPSWVRTRITG